MQKNVWWEPRSLLERCWVSGRDVIRNWLIWRERRRSLIKRWRKSSKKRKKLSCRRRDWSILWNSLKSMPISWRIRWVCTKRWRILDKTCWLKSREPSTKEWKLMTTMLEREWLRWLMKIRGDWRNSMAILIIKACYTIAKKTIM